MKTNQQGVSQIDRKAKRTPQSLRDKTTEAVINKLITPRTTAGNPATSGAPIPSALELNPIFRDTMQRGFDADRIMDVLPDLEQVAQIAISSILSTKDLITTTLIYSCESSSIPIELRAELLKIVRKYIDDDLKFPADLYDILYEVMFKSGSYPVAILPEASIDQLINGSVGGRVGVETYATDEFKGKLNGALGPKGILGNTGESKALGFGLEAIGLESKANLTEPEVIDLFSNTANEFGKLRIIDNPAILKLPKLQQTMAAAKVSNAYNVALEFHQESAAGMVARDVTGHIGKKGVKDAKDAEYFDVSMYKNPNYRNESIAQILSAEDAGRVSVGHPLVQFMPPESVIPVHVPGNFKQHVGYLVLIDQVGNPISRHDLGNSTEAWTWINGTASSQLIKDAADGLGLETSANRKEWTISKINNAYGRLVEAKLVQSLRNGVYGDSVTVAKPDEVYRIMMARSLAGRSTQILYIPVEQMAYFALDYNENGIGRSLTDKTRMVGTIRSALMFATMQASVLNATRNMEYTITLDPNDRDPEETIEKTQYRITQGYAGRIPYTGSVDDVQSYMANAGISFNIEGNDHYPSTKISVSDNTPDYKMPDQQIIDDQARRHYRGFGIDPDLILTPQNIELATQILSKDLIATKQTCKTQEKLAPLLTHFVKVYLISSGIIMKDLYDAIVKYLEPEDEEEQVEEGLQAEDIEEARSTDVIDDKEEKEKDFKEGEVGRYLNDFLANLEVTLPPPDMSLVASQMEAYDIQAQAIDHMLEAWVDENLFTLATGEIFSVDRMRNIVGNHLKRNWLRQNLVDPDMVDLFDNEEKRNEYVTTIAEEAVRIGTLLSRLQKRIDDRLTTVQKNEGIAMGDDFGGGSGGFGNDDDFGGGFGGDDDESFGSMDDDLNTDNDFEEEEEAPEQEEEQEEQPEEEEQSEETDGESEEAEFEEPEDLSLDDEPKE